MANHIEANFLELLFFLLLNSNTIQHIYCIAPTTVLQLRQRVERKKYDSDLLIKSVMSLFKKGVRLSKNL